MNVCSTSREIHTILHALRGEYRIPKAETIIIGIVCGIPVVVGIGIMVWQALQQKLSLVSVDGMTVVVGALGGIALIASFFLISLECCVFADHWVSLRRPWGITGWSIPIAAIHSITYERVRANKRRLTFVLHDGTTKKMICTKRMRQIIEQTMP